MDGAPQGPFEVLDFGRGRLRGSRPGVTPEETGEPLDGPPRRNWRKILSIALAFALGGTLGAYVWDGWRDRRESAKAASTAILIGGVTSVQPHSDGSVDITVVVDNVGPTTLHIDELRIVGWQRSPDQDPLDVEIESDRRVSVSDRNVVNCSAPTPTELSANVRTADGVSREVEVRLPGGSDNFQWPREVLCSPSQQGFSAFPEAVLQKGEDFVLTSVLIHNYGDEQLTITGVSPSTKAFRIEALDLPWQVGPGSDIGGPAQAYGLVRWTVNDCGLATEVLASDLRLDVDANGGERISDWGGQPDLPAVAELIRLGVRACQ